MKKSENKPNMFDFDEPFSLFENWMQMAQENEINDPNAIALATVDADGLPDVRMVLLKKYGPDGFVFYSHKNSTKGKQLALNPKAAFCMHWKSLRRQIRVRGHTETLSKADVASYFSTRSRESQLGAWASKQSEEMRERSLFEKAIEQAKQKFANTEVPLPPGWSGWRIKPKTIEFWQDRPFRLHDRLVFEYCEKTNLWTKHRLYP